MKVLIKGEVVSGCRELALVPQIYASGNDRFKYHLHFVTNLASIDMARIFIIYRIAPSGPLKDQHQRLSRPQIPQSH